LQVLTLFVMSGGRRDKTRALPVAAGRGRWLDDSDDRNYEAAHNAQPQNCTNHGSRESSASKTGSASLQVLIMAVRCCLRHETSAAATVWPTQRLHSLARSLHP